MATISKIILLPDLTVAMLLEHVFDKLYACRIF
jgi:hypothetical protein